MKCKTVFVSVTAGLFIAGYVQAQPARIAVKDANMLYDQQLYDEALQKYMDIQVEHPGEPILDFNIGNTLYKQQRFDEALEHYEKAVLNADQSLRARTNYNIGNTFYQKALQTETTGKLDESINLMREAVEYFKSALNQQPDDPDTKYNIEFVQQEIKRLLDKIKEQQEQQQNQQGQQGEGEQQEQQTQQGQQGQNEQEQQEGKEAQQGQEGQQDKESDDTDKQSDSAFKADPDKDKQQKGGKEDKKEAQELSEQEAGRLLDKLPDADKRKTTRQPQKGYLGEVEKNW
ncbi:MAG: tetratricopeptide repeat protein [Candidatus Auribacterota bacterium]|jgi:Ca-activated chloride channel family protein|nr:tetratricopeptide repeat protein [Candidatus Auribacterota bacterium]